LQSLKKKEIQIIDKSSVTKICIDDFAMKKRYTYGTVMIDIETRKIIDILESRDLEDVTKWLKTYANLQIVSRDGSQTYASAIKEAHPNAIQINDRFHLLKNLTDYCKKYITKTVNFKVKIEKSSNNEDTVPNSYLTTYKVERIQQAQSLQKEGLSLHQISKVLKMDIRTVKKYVELKIDEVGNLIKDASQLKHEESVNKKQKNIDIVRQLYKNGYAIKAISRETGLARKTVKRYLDLNISAVHASYGTVRNSHLTPFHNIIDTLLIKKFTFKKIEENIREQGYNGSSSAIRMYTTRKRRLMKQAKIGMDSNVEIVERQHLIKLLYKPLEKVKGISLNQLDAVVGKFPILSKIYKLVKSFKEILFKKDPDELNNWIEKAKLLNLSDINSFINGILRDIESVRNAIIYDYSNGLAEGSVNKIKVIKRIMYGRCNFKTLREKILKFEKIRKFN
jgi:transposase